MSQFFKYYNSDIFYLHVVLGLKEQPEDKKHQYLAITSINTTS